jgi:hypothetical protein
MAEDEGKTDQAIDKFNEKQALEQSLISRIDLLTAKIKEIVAKSKKNGADSKDETSEKEKPEEPAEPVPVPEPGEPDHQVLPLLFGLAFILIKIMNQANLNRQSIYNMNNYFEYITHMIEVYQKLCNSAVTKGYPIEKKTPLLINSLKSFYAYFYMAVSEKMQELFKGANYPEGTDWITALSPDEDKKLASVEFMNVIDDLFKDIHPAFVYMVEEYQLTDPATVAKMKGDMEALEESNSAAPIEENQGGGAYSMAQMMAAAKAAAATAAKDPKIASALQQGKAAFATAAKDPAIASALQQGKAAFATAAKDPAIASALQQGKAAFATAAKDPAIASALQQGKAAFATAAKDPRFASALKQGQAAVAAAAKNPGLASALNQGQAATAASKDPTAPKAAAALSDGPTADSQSASLIETAAALSGKSDAPAEEKKESIVFTKTPVPDECKINDICKRPVDTLKPCADEQKVQLERLLNEGLTTVTEGIDGVSRVLDDLSLNVKEIHISMVKRLEPVAEGSLEIGKILKELKEIKTALLNRIPVWIKGFDAASKIQSDKLNPTQLADVKRMGTTGMKMLNRIETLIKAESVFDKLLVKTETLSNQKGLKPDIIPIPKFQNLLTSMKKLLELLQKPAADNTTQVELNTIEKQLIVAIDEINKALPTILNIPAPPPTAEEKAAATASSTADAATPPAPASSTATSPASGDAVTPPTSAALSPASAVASSLLSSSSSELPKPAVGGKRVLRRSRKASKPKGKKTLRRR